MNFVSDEIFRAYFSAFSSHSIVFNGVTYKTVEHAYHAQRYDDAHIVQEIIDATTPERAWEISQIHKASQTPGFSDRKLSVMETLFPRDSWWGDGPDGSGRNEMGKLWMRLRDELKNEKNV